MAYFIKLSYKGSVLIWFAEMKNNGGKHRYLSIKQYVVFFRNKCRQQEFGRQVNDSYICGLKLNYAIFDRG